MKAVSLLVHPDRRPVTIAKALNKFPEHVLTFCAENAVRVHALRKDETYSAVSPSLTRLGVNVDSWPCPPAGLFVVEERTVYLRSKSMMTIAHEFAHAFDCALGGGVYRSSIDPAIRAAYHTATAFVTPYASTGTDEYFAECVRAYVEANDQRRFWPRVTRDGLKRIDPTMFAIVQNLIDQPKGHTT